MNIQVQKNSSKHRHQLTFPHIKKRQLVLHNFNDKIKKLRKYHSLKHKNTIFANHYELYLIIYKDKKAYGNNKKQTEHPQI